MHCGSNIFRSPSGLDVSFPLSDPRPHRCNYNRDLDHEPYPEQWDTFTSAAGSEFLFPPLEINKNHLLREGYSPHKIWTVGGVVTDAFDLKLQEKPSRSIFEQYPVLEKDQWIRMDIHRKGNLTPRRFRSIIRAVKTLVEEGYHINLIEMNATKFALEQYNLMGVIESLKKYPNFLYTPIWLEYSNVIEFFKSPSSYLVITDSGGVQEELNLLQKPLLTCRFNTDRPETILNGGNILAPPITPEFLTEEVKFVYNNDDLLKYMRSAPPLYGHQSGKKIVSILDELMEKNVPQFNWTHSELNLFHDDETDFGFK
ncbi:MAG: UDP-N-acetylglucosamine 2-epimerase [Promethearchaeota archaeon]